MKGQWVTYPGDFEIFLAEKVQTRRFQRDFPIAPFWRVDSPYHNLRFVVPCSLSEKTTLKIEAEGRISVAVMDPPYRFVYGFSGELTLEPGEYQLEIWVYHPTGIPALRITSDNFGTDENTLVGFNQYMMKPAAVCSVGNMTPNTYHLPYREISFLSSRTTPRGTVYDFGKMTVAFPVFQAQRDLPFRVYFGETESEVMSDSDCEQIDFFTPQNGTHTTDPTRAFQYMRVDTRAEYSFRVMEEYDDFPVVYSYDSDDAEMRLISDISAHTFSLCSREFFLDGVKRDRWIWSGDAFLGAKIDYYYSFNVSKIKATIIALLGKSPVVTYTNHIMDYSLYLFLTVREYYEHTGDIKFLSEIYPMLCEHIQFVLSRTNNDGFLYYQENDWVHIDWNSDLNKDGEVSFEQILLYVALRSFVFISSLLGHEASVYQQRADALKTKINEVFWDSDRGVFRHQRLNGQVLPDVTAYSNIFAILYDFVDGEQKKTVCRALQNDSTIPAITTPYMQAFLLSAFCECGEFDIVDRRLRLYFGNMAKTGTSTFWETYEIGEKKEEAVSMYGRPYGRSQCHIWGAGSILLLGKYYFGLKNDIDCGNSFRLTPRIDKIRGASATLPLKNGHITLACNESELTVEAKGANGTLVLYGREIPISENQIYHFPV